MKTISLNVIVNDEYYDTIDSYDATESYENALQCAMEELDWCNNQRWFDEQYGDEFPDKPCWKLVLDEY